MTLLQRMIQRFRSDETGTLLVEAVLVLPFMLWSYLALFVYWDSYRAVNTVQKSAYTISDMISREMVAVNDGYIIGMDSMLEYMIDQDQDAKLRVSSIYWSELNNRYEVHWSRSPHGAMTPLTTGSLVGMENRLPLMADGDFIVLVEVDVNYKAAFNVGMGNQVMSQFIATRPRFVTCVLMTGVGASCPLT